MAPLANGPSLYCSSMLSIAYGSETHARSDNAAPTPRARADDAGVAAAVAEADARGAAPA